VKIDEESQTSFFDPRSHNESAVQAAVACRRAVPDPQTRVIETMAGKHLQEILSSPVLGEDAPVVFYFLKERYVRTFDEA
jgi:hypothetical protein